MLRILLPTDSFPPGCGGSGWSVYELACALRARGHQVRIVQPRLRHAHASAHRKSDEADASPAATQEYDGFPIDEVPFAAPKVPYVRNYFKNERLTRRLAPRLEHLIARDAIDIVHAQHVLTGPAAIAAARRTGRPALCTVRDYWPVCYWSDLIHDPAAEHLCPACTPAMMTRCIRPRARAAWPLAVPLIPYMRANLARKRAALARADAIVAVSTRMAQDLRQRAPELAKARIEIIPNPVDFGAIDAREPGIRRSPRPVPGSYVVYVGKLAHNKGVVKLIEAARAAALSLPLVFVGSGPDREKLEAAASAAGLRTTWIGWTPREEAWRWMIHAALLAFPSHGPESLSRVLLEASALGVPIAAIDTGGTRDIIVPGETGLLAGDVPAFGRDLARLASDPALAARLGQAARAFVRARFDARRIAERTERLYLELLGRAESAGVTSRRTGDVET